MIGTQGYAPPEQYRGRVETRSDLYALGATMHHALSGRDPAAEPPFSFPPLRKLCPEINPNLAAIVDQALAYDVINRPADANEFKRRLLEAAGGGAAGQPTLAVLTNHADARPQLKLPLDVTQPGAAALPGKSRTPAAAANTPTSPTVLSVPADIKCPSCARTIPADSRFCSYCAADLDPGAIPAFTARPGDETLVLSTPRAPSREATVDRGQSGDFSARDRRRHRRRRRPVLILVLIFVGSFFLMKWFFRAQSENAATPSYGGGSGSGAPAAPAGPFVNARLAALRQALNLGGYDSVQFSPDGDAIKIWGTVPNDFDLSQVEFICVSLGFSKLEVNVQVAKNDDGTG